MNYCLSCFRKSNNRTDEREPLLSEHDQRGGGSGRAAHPVVERGTIDKIIDVLVALNTGKLPSQAQLSRFLQHLLKSELLKEDGRKVVSDATGPMSKEGRKVLGDVRNLVQAILHFGLEKNDDDKLQEIYYQVSQINATHVYQAGETTIDAVKEGAAKINDQVPSQEELSSDSATFLSALRTLVETFFASSVFRHILTDLFAIVRDLIAHAAADVEQTALQVQQVAEGVEKKAREDDEFIMPEMDVSGTINVVKDQGRQAMDKIEDAAQATKHECKSLGDEVADNTKQKILERIKQVISSAQKDAASRAAVRAILVLAQKYADWITSCADIAASAVSDLAEQASESLSKNEPSTSSGYPPQPYPSRSARFSIDSHSVTLLQNMKEMLERLGKGHVLDGLLVTSKKVVRDLNEVPVVLVDKINQEIEDKTRQLAEEDQPANGKGKMKKGRDEGSSSDKQKLSEDLSPAECKDSMKSPTQESVGSPLRAYFARIGAYLDRCLDNSGWAMSKESANTLEGLFDDGVKLVGAVDESMGEIGEETISPEVDQRDEVIRVRFKKDLKGFMEEVDAYVSAVENDQTTMRVFRALDILGDDLSKLLLQGVKKGRYGFSGLGGWTHWIGWAIPRLIRMVPRGAIPIPSLEIKTKNIKGGLYALFVQGLEGGRGDGKGRFGTKLIPDEVVLKEWTEVRIDMAERERPLTAPSSPGVQTTSRVHMHMDGVRAKVEDIGYYYKYFGGLIDYEDEGLVSADIGMSSLHNGLGVDIELEMEKDSVGFDLGVNTDIPEIIIEHEDVTEHSGKRDIQELVANGGSASRKDRETSSLIEEPIFRVVDVKVALAGLKFKIDKSRHWILNKLFLQPLAGPVIAHVVHQALEDKIRVGLENLALGLGAVAKDARVRGDIRRAKDLASGIDEEVEEGLREFLIDWWSAILQKGPMVLGYYKVGDGEGKAVETNTRTDVTMKGIRYSSTTKTREQPKGTPMMVYNKTRRTMKIVNPASNDNSENKTVVAIGAQAGDHSPVKDVKKAVDEVVEGVSEDVERIEDRWGKRKKVEKCSMETWKSDAFNLY